VIRGTGAVLQPADGIQDVPAILPFLNTGDMVTHHATVPEPTATRGNDKLEGGESSNFLHVSTRGQDPPSQSRPSMYNSSSISIYTGVTPPPPSNIAQSDLPGTNPPGFHCGCSFLNSHGENLMSQQGESLRHQAPSAYEEVSHNQYYGNDKDDSLGNSLKQHQNVPPRTNTRKRPRRRTRKKKVMIDLTQDYSEDSDPTDDGFTWDSVGVIAGEGNTDSAPSNCRHISFKFTWGDNIIRDDPARLAELFNQMKASNVRYLTISTPLVQTNDLALEATSDKYIPGMSNPEIADTLSVTDQESINFPDDDSQSVQASSVLAQSFNETLSNYTPAMTRQYSHSTQYTGRSNIPIRRSVSMTSLLPTTMTNTQYTSIETLETIEETPMEEESNSEAPPDFQLDLSGVDLDELNIFGGAEEISPLCKFRAFGLQQFQCTSCTKVYKPTTNTNYLVTHYRSKHQSVIDPRTHTFLCLCGQQIRIDHRVKHLAQHSLADLQRNTTVSSLPITIADVESA